MVKEVSRSSVSFDAFKDGCAKLTLKQLLIGTVIALSLLGIVALALLIKKNLTLADCKCIGWTGVAVLGTSGGLLFYRAYRRSFVNDGTDDGVIHTEEEERGETPPIDLDCDEVGGEGEIDSNRSHDKISLFNWVRDGIAAVRARRAERANSEEENGA